MPKIAQDERAEACVKACRKLADPSTVPEMVKALRSARSLLFWLAGADRLPAKETEYAVKEIETIDALLRKATEK